MEIFWTIEEVAKEAKCHHRTVRRALAKGKIIPDPDESRIRRRYMFPQAEALRWLCVDTPQAVMKYLKD